MKKLLSLIRVTLLVALVLVMTFVFFLLGRFKEKIAKADVPVPSTPPDWGGGGGSGGSTGGDDS